MDTTDFKYEMLKLMEKIVSSKENLSVGQWIDYGKIQDDFNDLVTEYLEISW